MLQVYEESAIGTLSGWLGIGNKISQLWSSWDLNTSANSSTHEWSGIKDDTMGQTWKSEQEIKDTDKFSPVDCPWAIWQIGLQHWKENNKIFCSLGKLENDNLAFANACILG